MTTYRTIYDTLINNWEWNRVVIAQNDCYAYLPLFTTDTAENKAAWQWLFDKFGKDRVERMIPDSTQRFNKGYNLYVRDVKNIFALSGDIRFVDLQSAHEDQFEELDKSRLDELWKKLMPIEEKQVMFWERFPDYRIHTEGTLYKRKLRVFNSLTLKEAPTEIDWFYRLNLRVLNLKLPKDVVLAHPNGYYRVVKKFDANGAHTFCLRGLNKELPPIVAFLGTQVTNIDSMKEDFRVAAGIEGVMTVFSDVKQWLTNPGHGLVREPNEKVIFTGYSLGANHACRMACLFSTRVQEVWSINGLGIDRETAKWAQERISQMKITYVDDIGDRTHKLGEVRLGYGANFDVTVHEIEPLIEEEVRITPREQSEPSNYAFLGVLDIGFGLVTAHTRDTAREYSYKKWTYRGEQAQIKLVGTHEHHRPRWLSGEPQQFIEFLNTHGV